MTNNDFESDHPRAAIGRFANKEQSTPQVTLAAPQYTAGDELPNLWPGTAVDIDGEIFYRVMDVTFHSQWLSAEGNAAVLEESDFRILHETEQADDGLILRPVATFRPGDTIFDEDDSTELGTVKRLVRSAGSIEIFVHMTDGSTIVTSAGEVFSTRPVEPRTYSPENTYWNNVDAVSDPHTGQEMLELVLATESEDDFMGAIIDNPNSTAEIIEKASQHHSLYVRRAAVFNPKTSNETLQRIRDEANATSFDESSSLTAEGISPQASYRRDAIAANDSLARAVVQVLNRRSAATAGRLTKSEARRQAKRA